MQNIVQQYIQNHGLLLRGKPCVVALSGGADSVALLRVLLSLGYAVEAAHCNFHLRGEESQRDEAFCQRLCQQLGVSLHLAHFDTREYASLHHQSIELAARNLRYAWFEQLRRDLDAQAVCVAHHRDDSVETILMNLVRGTGISGLTGISPRRDTVVRPLLCVSRQDILRYLQRIGQDYVTDSTNLRTDEATRNLVRLELMPLLRRINPKAPENIMRAAAHLSVAERLADSVADNILACAVAAQPDVPGHAGRLSIATTQLATGASYMLHRWLAPRGFNSSQVEDVARHLEQADGGGAVWLSATHELALHAGRLTLAPRHEPMSPLTMPETGRYVVRAGGSELRCSLYIINVENDFSPSRRPWAATLDADTVEWPLRLRRWQAGDRFQPLGMRGHRLVSDVLTDRRMSPLDKQLQMVLEDHTGRIVWLPGLMPCHHCRVTEGTRRVLTCSIELPQQAVTAD